MMARFMIIWGNPYPDGVPLEAPACANQLESLPIPYSAL